jgi:hypothetical protein
MRLSGAGNYSIPGWNGLSLVGDCGEVRAAWGDEAGWTVTRRSQPVLKQNDLEV